MFHNMRKFASGLVLGTVVGGAIGLLIAPTTGDATRNMLRERGEQLRDKAMQTAEDARAAAEDMQARGKAIVTDNVERVQRTAEAVKRTAQETWQQDEGAAAGATTGQAQSTGARTGNTGTADY